jgi:hypothetical protein
MFGFHLHHKSDVLDNLSALRAALANKDPKALEELEQQATASGQLDGTSVEDLRLRAIASLDASIAAATRRRPRLARDRISPTTSSPASSSPP